MGDRKPDEGRRFSVNTLWSIASQQDDVEDDLTKGLLLISVPCLWFFFVVCKLFFSAAQKKLKQMKNKISAQSKKNFLLERDVRYLDGRIALLIQHRSAQETEVWPASKKKIC